MVPSFFVRSSPAYQLPQASVGLLGRARLAVVYHSLGLVDYTLAFRQRACVHDTCLFSPDAYLLYSQARYGVMLLSLSRGNATASPLGSVRLTASKVSGDLSYCCLGELKTQSSCVKNGCSAVDRILPPAQSMDYHATTCWGFGLQDLASYRGNLEQAERANDGLLF